MRGWFFLELCKRQCYLHSLFLVEGFMLESKELNQRLQRLAGLVGELESIADPQVRATTKDLVQLVMDMHSAALERILEKMFAAGETGQRLIDQLGADPLVSSLLVLYGLHPEELGTRVSAAVQKADVELRSHGVHAELLGVRNGVVRVRAIMGANTCGSSAATARTVLENAIYEAAPDITSLVIEGLDGKQASGFVSLDKLMGGSEHARVQPVSSNATTVLNEATGD